MSLIDRLRYQLRVWLRPRAHERELAEEIRFHLSLETMQREHGARGTLSATDPEGQARRLAFRFSWYCPTADRDRSRLCRLVDAGRCFHSR